MDRPPGGVRWLTRASAAEREADLKTVARGGTLNFAGSVVNGVLQFALVVVVTQALTKSEAGAFFEAVALFIILSNTCELGADTGLTRMIPRLRVLGRIADIRRSMAVGILPGFAGRDRARRDHVLPGRPAGGGLHEPPARRRRAGGDVHPGAGRRSCRVSAAYTVSIAATRGFGTMLPNALVDRIGRAVLQLLGVGAVVIAGGGAFGVALGWGIPIAVAFAVTLVWLVRLITKVEHEPGERVGATSAGSLWSEFWKFTAPRGLTGVFQVTILWIGTLLVGSLLDAAHASVYTASTRYLVAGSVVNYAIITAIAPKLSELLSGNEHERARDVYQVATCWLMTLAWPLYFTLAVFAPLLLRVFKPQYAAGAVVARAARRGDARRDRDRACRHRAADGRAQHVEPVQRGRRAGAQPRRSASCSSRRSGSPGRRAPGPRRSSSTTSRRSPRSARS